jgi:hypothetical protein
VSCHSHLQSPGYIPDFFAAGLFPGQAVLMANMIEVFTLTGSEMTDRGDFFAAMFVALAGASLFSYYVMGWGTNTIAQVRHLFLPLASNHILINLDSDSSTQVTQATLQRHSSSRPRVLRPPRKQHWRSSQPHRCLSTSGIRADGLQHRVHCYCRV